MSKETLGPDGPGGSVGGCREAFPTAHPGPAGYSHRCAYCGNDVLRLPCKSCGASRTVRADRARLHDEFKIPRGLGSMQEQPDVNHP